MSLAQQGLCESHAIPGQVKRLAELMRKGGVVTAYAV